LGVSALSIQNLYEKYGGEAKFPIIFNMPLQC